MKGNKEKASGAFAVCGLSSADLCGGSLEHSPPLLRPRVHEYTQQSLTTGPVLLSGQESDSCPAIFHGSPSSMENSHTLALANAGGEGCPPRLPFCLRQQTLSVPPLAHVPDFLLLASASL